MNLFTQKFVMDRLKISRSCCWRIFGKGGKRGLFSERRVLDILNAHTYNMKDLSFLPDNFITVEETAKTISVNGMPISTKRLVNWVNNLDFEVPHIKFSSHLIRIQADLLEKWVEETLAGEGKDSH